MHTIGSTFGMRAGETVKTVYILFTDLMQPPACQKKQINADGTAIGPGVNLLLRPVKISGCHLILQINKGAVV